MECLKHSANPRTSLIREAGSFESWAKSIAAPSQMRLVQKFDTSHFSLINFSSRMGVRTPRSVKWNCRSWWRGIEISNLNVPSGIGGAFSMGLAILSANLSYNLIFVVLLATG